MALDFEWYAAKAESNLRKHGISFEEAASAFADPLSLTIADRDRWADEDRWILVGLTYLNRLVVVVHVERGVNIRLISARLATRAERCMYEEVN